MSMDFYLPRTEQKALRDTLQSIPGLAEDLSITITRQARVTRPGLGHLRRQKPESRIPYHGAAAEAATELLDCLATWTRFFCDHRQIHYRDKQALTQLARFLNQHITALALIEGSETAYADIHHHVTRCRTLIDLPPDDDIYIDRTRLTAANKSIVTLATIGPLAARLGDLGKGLTRDRLRLLAKHGDLKPASIDPETRTHFYRLGDVLHAHHHRHRRLAKPTKKPDTPTD